MFGRDNINNIYATYKVAEENYKLSKDIFNNTRFEFKDILMKLLDEMMISIESSATLIHFVLDENINATYAVDRTFSGITVSPALETQFPGCFALTYHGVDTISINVDIPIETLMSSIEEMGGTVEQWRLWLKLQ